MGLTGRLCDWLCGHAALTEDAELPLRMSGGGQLPKAAVRFKNAGYGYPGMATPLFTGAEFMIDGKSRIVVLGETCVDHTMCLT